MGDFHILKLVKMVPNCIKHHIQSVFRVFTRKEKKICVLHELENKMQLGVWVHFKPLNGFSGPKEKALQKFTIFSLKLA